MNLIDALKAVAPAVGDGRLIPAHAYVRYNGGPSSGILRGMTGEMSVATVVDANMPEQAFCVRHASLVQALSREGATQAPHPYTNGVVVRVGRGRTTLKGIDSTDFPDGLSFTDAGAYPWSPVDEFRDVLANLTKFTGGGDGHIWQMGVHFRSDFAFAMGPFAAAFTDYSAPFDLAVPPWSAKFILAQDEKPYYIRNGTNTFRAEWEGVVLTSTRLIEDAPDAYHSHIENMPRAGGLSVPPNLKETVARLKAYGVKHFRLGNGRIDHVDERLEIEEEVDLDVPPRTWGVEQMLAALEFAETIDLSGDNAVWHGNGYHGLFSGRSG